jgi:hypothetical protein
LVGLLLDQGPRRQPLFHPCQLLLLHQYPLKLSLLPTLLQWLLPPSMLRQLPMLIRMLLPRLGLMALVGMRQSVLLPSRVLPRCSVPSLRHRRHTLPELELAALTTVVS